MGTCVDIYIEFQHCAKRKKVAKAIAKKKRKEHERKRLSVKLMRLKESDVYLGNKSEILSPSTDYDAIVYCAAKNMPKPFEPFHGETFSIKIDEAIGTIYHHIYQMLP